MKRRPAISPFWTTTLLWVLAGLGLAYAWDWLAEGLWIVAPAVPAAWALVGLGLLGVVGWRALCRQGSWRRVVALPVAVALVLAAAGPLAAWGEERRLHGRLRPAAAALDGILDRHPPGGPTTGWLETEDGLSYRIDAGPPVRVAFLLPGGILDNWTAIVFDPTGEVMRADAFAADWSTWNEPALAPFKALFGGDLLWCRPLDATFYLCGFT